jgi:hypothetical protein
VLRCPDNNNDPNKTGWIYMNLIDQLLNLKWTKAPDTMTFVPGIKITEIGVHADHTITLIGDDDSVALLSKTIEQMYGCSHVERVEGCEWCAVLVEGHKTAMQVMEAASTDCEGWISKSKFVARDVELQTDHEVIHVDALRAYLAGRERT